MSYKSRDDIEKALGRRLRSTEWVRAGSVRELGADAKEVLKILGRKSIPLCAAYLNVVVEGSGMFTLDQVCAAVNEVTFGPACVKCGAYVCRCAEDAAKAGR